MPESKRRKKRNTTAQQGGESSSALSGAEQFGFEDLEAEEQSLPGWYKVTMFGLMILGLLWLITWYVTSGALPISAAGGWNIIIGFSIAMVGFFMTMKWK
ncbi:cell division protein CrgA [Nesterenkonia alkaliphila]|uniref:cell division protein CrgA n=1 Tax=Nesterenkonia alkaliphila TaxID=1463631 RepID=UPI0019AE281B|nr:cell division protein CrgA [Nesterenkonia alkaliphila]GFZ87953.1 cell division protein CrgA [Nesterenkonia alkaliphila]